MKRIIFIFAVLFSVAASYAQTDGCLNSYDREIIASCMVLEAAGDGAEGMQAVLNVIINRAKGDLNRMVPATVKHGAFSCMASIWSDIPDYSPLLSRAQNQPESFANAMNLIAIMEQGLLSDITGGATHYHATYINPYWVSTMRYITTIGGHHFYVERGRQVASL